MTLLETVEPLLALLESLVDKCNNLEARLAAAESIFQPSDPDHRREHLPELSEAPEHRRPLSGTQVVTDIRARLAEAIRAENRLTIELLRRPEVHLQAEGRRSRVRRIFAVKPAPSREI